MNYNTFEPNSSSEKNSRCIASACLILVFILIVSVPFVIGLYIAWNHLEVICLVSSLGRNQLVCWTIVTLTTYLILMVIGVIMLGRKFLSQMTIDDCFGTSIVILCVIVVFIFSVSGIIILVISYQECNGQTGLWYNLYILVLAIIIFPWVLAISFIIPCNLGGDMLDD